MERRARPNLPQNPEHRTPPPLRAAGRPLQPVGLAPGIPAWIPEQAATGALLVGLTKDARTVIVTPVKTHATYRVGRVGASVGLAKSARRKGTAIEIEAETDTGTKRDVTEIILGAVSGTATRSVSGNGTATGMLIGSANGIETVIGIATAIAETRRIASASPGGIVSFRDALAPPRIPLRPTIVGCPTSLTLAVTEVMML